VESRKILDSKLAISFFPIIQPLPIYNNKCLSTL